MRAIKKHMALAIVMALAMAGGLLLAFDYETAFSKWTAIIGAAVLFTSAAVLGFYFDRKKMLPE